jgi:hypothetical protein
MKRLLLTLLFGLCFALLVVPVSAQDGYQEGLEVSEGYGSSFGGGGLTLRATKVIEGNNVYTEVRLFRWSQIWGCETVHVDTVVRLPGDPDWLEVSNDLGWGGLDGAVWVQRRTRTYHSYFPCTYTETAETVPVEIHLNVVARSGYAFDGTNYIRRGDVQGTVTLGNDAFTFVPGYNVRVSQDGYTFSNRTPFDD